MKTHSSVSWIANSHHNGEDRDTSSFFTHLELPYSLTQSLISLLYMSNMLFLLMDIILIFIFVEKNYCVYLKNYIMPYPHVNTVFS